MRNIMEILNMLVWAAGIAFIVYVLAAIVSQLGWWVL